MAVKVGCTGVCGENVCGRPMRLGEVSADGTLGTDGTVGATLGRFVVA